MAAASAATHPLIRRVRAAESTIGRFDRQPLVWGSQDCLRMAAHCLRQLGHAPPLRDAGPYRSPLGARRALKRTGFASLDRWVDSWGLPRIPAAMALPADVLAYETEDAAMPALALQLSNGRIFGFEPGAGVCCVIALNPGVVPLAAWSV